MGDVSCGMVMLNMDASFFCSAVFFRSCGMGMNGAGFWRASVRSAAVCVAAFSGESLGNLFCTGNSSAVPDFCSNSILGIYDVRH